VTAAAAAARGAGVEPPPADDRGSTPAALDFALPPALEADRPPEARGLRRDEVRLMVTAPGRRGEVAIEHARFRDLPQHLDAGDLLVVNVSATLPAAVPAELAGRERIELRFSTEAPRLAGGGWWVIEMRAARGARPYRGRAVPGERLSLPGGAGVELVAPYLGTRLWLARFEASGPLHPYLSRHGAPVRYGYLSGDWPLDAFQTVFALEPGSAEMPSAARPFTPELVTRLVAGGVGIAPITLHTGLSSPELGEAPYPEHYSVPDATARAVNAARAAGGRVVAVGTTVVRALESVAGPGSAVEAGEGWTDLVVTPRRPPRAVDGLITGWHAPRASHLELLEAIAGRPALERAHAEALARRYLWHELGDSHLIVPAPEPDQRGGPR